jgi:Xaa-Pro aminopeptidase
MGDRLPAWGHTSVDFERRIDHDRLRRYRLARTRQSLQASPRARSCCST